MRWQWIFVVLTTAIAVPAVAQTIDQFRGEFVKSFGDECLKIQRSAPANANVADVLVVKYCGCVTKHAPEVVTVDDLMDINKTGQRSRNLQNKLNALGKT